MIPIDGLHALAEALARSDFSAPNGTLLNRQRTARNVRAADTLHRPGEDHSAPWLCTRLFTRKYRPRCQ